MNPRHLFRSVFVCLAIVLPLFVVLPMALAVNWTGSDMTWTAPDANSFDAIYNNGDAAVFGDTGVGAVTLSGTINPGSLTFTNTVGNNYTFTGTGIIGSGGLALNGGGELYLQNAFNTYTGPTTVNAGILRTSTTNNTGNDRRLFPLTALTIANGATFHFRNTEAVGSLAGNGTLSNSTGNTGFWVGYDNSDTTFSGTWNLAGGGDGELAKMGTGTLTLTSQPNKSLSVRQGTVRLAGTGGNLGNNSPMIHSGGTLTADNTVDEVNRLGGNSSGSTPNLAGGEMLFLGNSSLASFWSWGRGFNGGGPGNATVTLVPGAGQTAHTRQGHNDSAFTIIDGGAMLVRGDDLGNTARFTANAQSAGVTIRRHMVGGTVDGVGPTFSNYGTPRVPVLRHTIGDASSSGLGSGFVTYDVNNIGGVPNASQDTNDVGIRLLTASEYSATIADGEAFADPTLMENKRLSSAVTGIDNPTRVTTLTLAENGSVAGAGTLIVQSGDILSTGSNGSIGVATLQPGATILKPAGEQVTLITPADDDFLSISSQITGTNLGLVKSGHGTVVLTGSNGYTGATTINRGALRAADGIGLPVGSLLRFGGDGVLEGTGTFNRTIGGTAGNVQWHAQGSGGFAAQGGVFNIQLNGGANLTWDSTNFVQGHQRLIFGSATADNRVDFQNNLALGTFDVQSAGDVTESIFRTIEVIDNPNSTADYARLSGVISGTDAQLTLRKTGDGTLELTNANTYVGRTEVLAGTLLVNGSLGGAGMVTVAAGATLGGRGSVSGATSLAGLHTPGNSAGIQTFGGSLSYTAGAAVEWELVDNTTLNQPNPNALFDTVVVAGNLDFAGATTLSLVFDLAGSSVDWADSSVDWADSFWAGAYLGSDGWLLYQVAGSTSNFANLSLAESNWLDGGGNAFDTLRAKGEFSLYLDGSNIYLNYALIPEPASLALLAAGGLLALRRRR